MRWQDGGAEGCRWGRRQRRGGRPRKGRILIVGVVKYIEFSSALDDAVDWVKKNHT